MSTLMNPACSRTVPGPIRTSGRQSSCPVRSRPWQTALLPPTPRLAPSRTPAITTCAWTTRSLLRGSLHPVAAWHSTTPARPISPRPTPRPTNTGRSSTAEAATRSCPTATWHRPRRRRHPRHRHRRRFRRLPRPWATSPWSTSRRVPTTSTRGCSARRITRRSSLPMARTPPPTRCSSPATTSSPTRPTTVTARSRTEPPATLGTSTWSSCRRRACPTTASAARSAPSSTMAITTCASTTCTPVRGSRRPNAAWRTTTWVQATFPRPTPRSNRTGRSSARAANRSSPSA